MPDLRSFASRLIAALLSLSPAIPEAGAAESEAGSATAPPAGVTQFIIKTRPTATPQSTYTRDVSDSADASLVRRAVEKALRQDAPAPARMRRAAERVIDTRAMSGGARVVTLDQALSRDTAAAVAARLQAQPEIEYAEVNLRLYAQAAPTDPLYRSQWGFGDAIGAARFAAAWDVTTGSAATVIAVLDTGNRPHPDLAANLLPGYDFLTDPIAANDGDGRDPDASDPGDWMTAEESLACDGTVRLGANSTWHGTHVMGTIGATANNAIGGAGGVWPARMVPVRVLGKCGGAESDIIDGLRWAVGLPVPGVAVNPHPAKIVNMSLGTMQPCSRAMQEAIDDVVAQGATPVAAAGNGGFDVGEPASCRGVIAVAAIDADGNKGDFSNWGERIDLGAPGVGILSTFNTGLTVPAEDAYRSLNGTSMAAPHVTAAVALMLAVEPSLSPDPIRETLRATARPYPPASNCAATQGRTACGMGMLDAAAAVAAARARSRPPAVRLAR